MTKFVAPRYNEMTADQRRDQADALMEYLGDMFIGLDARGIARGKSAFDFATRELRFIGRVSRKMGDAWVSLPAYQGYV